MRNPGRHEPPEYVTEKEQYHRCDGRRWRFLLGEDPPSPHEYWSRGKAHNDDDRRYQLERIPENDEDTNRRQATQDVEAPERRWWEANRERSLSDGRVCQPIGPLSGEQVYEHDECERHAGDDWVRREFPGHGGVALQWGKERVIDLPESTPGQSNPFEGAPPACRASPGPLVDIGSYL